MYFLICRWYILINKLIQFLNLLIVKMVKEMKGKNRNEDTISLYQYFYLLNKTNLCNFAHRSYEKSVIYW